MPYDGYHGLSADTAVYLRKTLMDESSGVDRPAAILVETVQGKGGINVGSSQWLRSIQAIAKDVGALLIVDDIQMGCGRTGDFLASNLQRCRQILSCCRNRLVGMVCHYQCC